MPSVTIMIKLPLFKPTKTKEDMYLSMQEEFSTLANHVLELKKTNPKQTKTNIDHQLKQCSQLPTTLQQEARKLALSRYQDWKKNQKTKSFPSFKKKQTVLFNNQNWHFRYDGNFLKLGFPTREKGNLTVDKYVPVLTNAYSSFWVEYLLTGKMDMSNKTYNLSYQNISSIKKGNGQLYQKRGKWFFAFSITLEIQEQQGQKVVGVDRGLRLIAVAGCGSTKQYLTFSGKHLGHIRRKYHKLRRSMQKSKNTKAVKRLENKEQRIINYYNHVISKKIFQFAEQIGATTIKLEDLTGIRRMKKYWKRTDRNIHSWAFYDLGLKIQYKATLHGLKVEYVDPYKTSQECFRCKQQIKSNRRKDQYTCSCGYKENADINASFVISTRPEKIVA